MVMGRRRFSPALRTLGARYWQAPLRTLTWNQHGTHETEDSVPSRLTATAILHTLQSPKPHPSGPPGSTRSTQSRTHPRNRDSHVITRLSAPMASESTSLGSRRRFYSAGYFRGDSDATTIRNLPREPTPNRRSGLELATLNPTAYRGKPETTGIRHRHYTSGQESS